MFIQIEEMQLFRFSILTDPSGFSRPAFGPHSKPLADGLWAASSTPAFFFTRLISCSFHYEGRYRKRF
jgi:hypothetical protein